ncbi:MAG: Rrf2 family transcriptional regulator [Calditrichia bacterium]
MLLSNTCDYGIRAALYVATQKNRDFVPIREISEELNISFHFLTKILQKLTQAGLMTSFRGPNGGVTLARPAAQISLYDIIVAIDGPMLFKECVLGLANCGDEAPCPLHHQWAGIRSQLMAMFQNSILENMSENIMREGFRLKDTI